MNDVVVDGQNLSVSSLVRVARHKNVVVFDTQAKERMDASRGLLEHWIRDEKIVYGITTGFGPLVSRLVPTQFQSELQHNLIRSHSANVGPMFPTEEVRAAMLLRLNVFAKGYSAVRFETAERLRIFLNLGIHPCVPQWGSVGASGDLTPSAHIALSILGEGKAEHKGMIREVSEILRVVGMPPFVFQAKEGLAFINGTTVMTGAAALQVGDAWNLVRTAEIIGALSIEALQGSVEPFLKEAHELKPHPGQIKTARNLVSLLSGSGLVWNREKLEQVREDLRKKMKQEGNVVESGVQVQNAYSLRATPQILGAVRDALAFVTHQITTEMNSASDNPLFLSEQQIAYQGAHFHGQSVALPMDVLCISLTEIGILSERRLNRMLDSVRSGGLSPFLAGKDAGLHCGFEGAQYIPTSLVAECRTLCNPASIQSIPSNAENQDVVSMGLIAARKARDIKEKIEYILAVELLVATQAVEERGEQFLGRAGRELYKEVRAVVQPLTADRIMSDDIETIKNFIHEQRVVQVAEKVLGSVYD